MRLKDFMTQNVKVISAESTLTAAANIMARLNIGFLPVIDDGQLVGAITDRDIVVRGVAEIRNPTMTKVADIMTEGMESISPQEDVEAAAKRMQDKQIRRLVINDGDGQCQGIVSLGDIAHQVQDCEISGKSLEKICEPVAGGN